MRININIDKEMHYKVKRYCLENHTNISKLVRDYLRELVEGAPKRKPLKVSTDEKKSKPVIAKETKPEVSNNFIRNPHETDGMRTLQMKQK